MSLHTQDFEYVKTNIDPKGIDVSSRAGSAIIGNGNSNHGKNHYL